MIGTFGGGTHCWSVGKKCRDVFPGFCASKAYECAPLSTVRLGKQGIQLVHVRRTTEYKVGD